jgi:hypothetical protein
MINFGREKDVKEATRREELSKRETSSMNQEDNTKATEQRQKMQRLLKDTMKKVALEKTSGEEGGQQKEEMRISKKKKAEKKRKRNDKEKNGKKEANKTNKPAIDNKKKARPQQGKQVIPMATYVYGCSHKGLLELKKQLFKNLHERGRVDMEGTKEERWTQQ